MPHTKKTEYQIRKLNQSHHTTLGQQYCRVSEVKHFTVPDTLHMQGIIPECLE